MTAPSSKLHPMIASQVANAGIRLIQIEAVAKHLSDLMKDVHGGEWRVQIEHQHNFIMVAGKFK